MYINIGVYHKIAATLTIAPSMDISVSSNFERYLFYLAGANAETLASWMDSFESSGMYLLVPLYVYFHIYLFVYVNFRQEKCTFANRYMNI
jgi:threonine synthase